MVRRHLIFVTWSPRAITYKGFIFVINSYQREEGSLSFVRIPIILQFNLTPFTAVIAWGGRIHRCSSTRLQHFVEFFWEIFLSWCALYFSYILPEQALTIHTKNMTKHGKQVYEQHSTRGATPRPVNIEHLQDVLQMFSFLSAQHMICSVCLVFNPLEMKHLLVSMFKTDVSWVNNHKALIIFTTVLAILQIAFT